MLIGQALADHGRKSFRESLAIGRLAIVESKRLFVALSALPGVTLKIIWRTGLRAIRHTPIGTSIEAPQAA
jgi:hypothetical protein